MPASPVTRANCDPDAPTARAARIERGQLGVAPDEELVAGAGLSRSSLRASVRALWPIGWWQGAPTAVRRPGQVGVVSEHLTFQVLKLWRRVEPEVLGQAGPKLLVHSERIGMTAGSVQGDHALGVRGLA